MKVNVFSIAFAPALAMLAFLASMLPLAMLSPSQVASAVEPSVTFGNPTTTQIKGTDAVSTNAVVTPCIQPPDDLVGWWPGDVGANDISGNDNHGELKNGAQAGISGKVAGAFDVDGVNDVVDTPVLVPSRGTLDLWLRLDSLDNVHGVIGTFGKANGNDRLWITGTGPLGGPGAGPNRLVINLGSCCVNDIDIPNPFAVGEWTHLGLTFDYISDTYRLYINGQVATSTTALRNTPTEPLSLGGFSSTFGQSFYSNGLIDEVQVFDRVLDNEEILAIYNAGSSGKCKEPKLTVSKSASPDPVQAGQPLTYTLYVTNTGRGDLNATVTDTLPANIVNGKTSSGLVISPGGILTWSPIITAPGGVWTETVVITTEVDYAGLLTNVVQVSSVEGATGIYTTTSTVQADKYRINLPMVVKN